MPAAAQPAQIACSRYSPEARVSLPMTACGREPAAFDRARTLAAATASFTAVNGVIGSRIARPRMPSVPKMRVVTASTQNSGPLPIRLRAAGGHVNLRERWGF